MDNCHQSSFPQSSSSQPSFSPLFRSLVCGSGSGGSGSGVFVDIEAYEDAAALSAGSRLLDGARTSPGLVSSSAQTSSHPVPELQSPELQSPPSLLARGALAAA
eukprot:scaffold117543_cov80-Phaeocystis_antarctica.AAC.7